MMRMAGLIVLSAAVSVAAAAAQTTGSDQPSTLPSPPASPAQPTMLDQAFRQAMERTHREMMSIEPSGNAAIDYARLMVLHHRGAIEMSHSVLEHTDNNKIRDIAEDVIDDQKEEIEDLQEWLAEQPSTMTPTGTVQ